VRLLRPFWANLVAAPWILGALVSVIAVASRGALMLGPSRGTGPWLPLYFLVLAATPFVFLTREGRRSIGLNTRPGAKWGLLAVLIGVLAGAGAGALGSLLYGASLDNWYVTVGQTMLSDERLRAMPTGQLFVALAVPAALFSPVGEELFFRGVLHESVAARTGHGVAAALSAAAFGLMHAFHHGVTATAAGIDVRLSSGGIWVVLTITLGLLLIGIRLRSRSMWSAVSCHAAFNVAMVAFIVSTQLA
jgi:membrane protease YdiL (CAAX protease family)